MIKYKAVSFDAGGTLLEPWPSVGHVYAAVAKEHGLGEFDPLDLNLRFGKAWKELNDFDYSRTAWADLVVQTLGRSHEECGVSTRLFQSLYARFTEPEVWHVYDDVRPTLCRLRELELKLAVISNWDERLEPLLDRLNLAQSFDVIQVSCQVGCQKPDARIFHTAAKKMGISPDKVLHVGDSAKMDWAGGRQAGMGALLLRRGTGGDGKAEIGSLAEIAGRLQCDWSLASGGK